jgi:hypothetical protein
MAQQTDAQECQRASEILSLLTDATEGDVLLANGDDTRWELASKNRDDGITVRAVFYREDNDPHGDGYDWRDDPRLIIEYVRERHAPARHPDYTIRQVGEGVIEEGEITRLTNPESNRATWSVLADPDTEDLTRLPVGHENGELEVIAVGDELIQHVVTDDPGLELRRVTVSDVLYRQDEWRVEVKWGRDRRRSAAVDVAAALNATDGGLDRNAPAQMPDDAMVWFPELEG